MVIGTPSLSVLVVDNEQTIRYPLRRLMRLMGFDVVEAADGAEALSALAGRSFDLILTDLQMPRLDGIGMVRQIRRDGRRMPIIMMSGVTEPAVVAAAKGAGVDLYIAKPVDPQRLSEAVLGLLEREAPAETAARAVA